MSAYPLGRRPGLAIPIALVLVGAAALALIMAFTTASAGTSVAGTDTASLDAYAIAQSGLERFVADRAAYGFVGAPATNEKARIQLPAGHADVELHRVRDGAAGLPALYALRSRGTALVADREAEQVVAQLAVWSTATFAPPAVWTAIGDRTVHVRGRIDGSDACAASASLPAERTGAVTDPGVRIDWRGIVDGTALSASSTIGPAAELRYRHPRNTPIIRVDGDHELRGDGRGTLIVTGDLLIMNRNEWRGLVLAGGRVVMRPGARIEGAVVTGLNSQTGIAPVADDVIEQGAAVRYDACAVASAADAFGALALVPGTWLDGWATP